MVTTQELYMSLKVIVTPEVLVSLSPEQREKINKLVTHYEHLLSDQFENTILKETADIINGVNSSDSQQTPTDDAYDRAMKGM